MSLDNLMGNKYVEQFCNRCGENTLWRVTRRFGRADRKTGTKGLRRRTTKCIYCQTKIIEGRHRKRATHVINLGG